MQISRQLFELMIILTPVRRALQGPSISTGGDHHWWDLRCSQMRTLRWKVR